MPRSLYKYNTYDNKPSDFEMAVLNSNASDQFENSFITPQFTPESMERYQIQMLKTSTPEIRLPGNFDNVVSGRKNFKRLNDQLHNGGWRGNNDAVYKPELEQSNINKYFVGDGSTYYIAPNYVSKKDINDKAWNLSNRLARYKNVKGKEQVENTDQINDYLVDQRDGNIRQKFYRTTAKRLIRPFEVNATEGYASNRYKNMCRDNENIAYKSRNPSYDTDVVLFENMMNSVMSTTNIKKNNNILLDKMVSSVMKKEENYHEAKNKSKNYIKKEKINEEFDHEISVGEDNEYSNNSFDKKMKIKSEYGPLPYNPIKLNLLLDERINEIKQKINIKKGKLQRENDKDDVVIDETDEQNNKFLKVDNKINSKQMRIKVTPLKELNERLSSNLIKTIVPQENFIGANSIQEFSDNQVYESNNDKDNRNNQIKSKMETFLKPGVNKLADKYLSGSNKIKPKADRQKVYGDKLGYRGDFGRAIREYNVPSDNIEYLDAKISDHGFIKKEISLPNYQLNYNGNVLNEKEQGVKIERLGKEIYSNTNSHDISDYLANDQSAIYAEESLSDKLSDIHKIRI